MNQRTFIAAVLTTFALPIDVQPRLENIYIALSMPHAETSKIGLAPVFVYESTLSVQCKPIMLTYPDLFYKTIVPCQKMAPSAAHLIFAHQKNNIENVFKVLHAADESPYLIRVLSENLMLSFHDRYHDFYYDTMAALALDPAAYLFDRVDYLDRHIKLFQFYKEQLTASQLEGLQNAVKKALSLFNLVPIKEQVAAIVGSVSSKEREAFTNFTKSTAGMCAKVIYDYAWLETLAYEVLSKDEREKIRSIAELDAAIENKIKLKSNQGIIAFLEKHAGYAKKLYAGLLDIDQFIADKKASIFNESDFPGKYSLQQTASAEWMVTELENVVKILEEPKN